MIATILSTNDYTKKIAPILVAGLPQVGVCRNMSRYLVHEPTRYQEIEIDNFYTMQGIEQVQARLDQFWWETNTGKLIHISVENTNLE